MSRRPERPRSSPGARFARRVVVLVVVLLALAAGLWLATSAIEGAASDAAETTTPPTTAPSVSTSTPKAPELKIVFPEGFTREEMAQRVTAVKRIAQQKRKLTPKLTSKGYLAASAKHPLPGQFARDSKARTLEGFLFPATYAFAPATTSKQLVEKQLDAFRRNWEKVDLAYARSKNLTAYDVLTIASMIEKETVAPEERKLVAAVIYNRLRVGMPLGIDATIRYGLDVPGTEPLRQSHLQSDNPYNTRNRLGLPPTPISNPGLASMQAAARPANVDYLFYVRKPDKVHHFFTASEQEFLRKVCEYQGQCG